MIEEIKKWKNDGEYVSFGPFEHKVFAKQLGKKRALAHKTLLLVHGFPESSYSFHKVINGLLEFFERIIVFDMLGYGLSDKPIKNYSYSLFEQADVALTILKYFEVKGGHLLAHDMGDSVATELVARHENQLLPEWFSDGFQSLTFTNGSMVLGLAKLRMTQKVLLSNYGSILKNMTTFKIFKQQVISAHGNNKLSEEDVKSLWDFNELQDGIRKTYLTIKYLNDRKRFEKTRWLRIRSVKMLS